MNKCILCKSENIKEDKLNKSLFCLNCKCLINLNAKEINYFKGGGQNLPNKEKRKFRLNNAKLRFKIINKYLNKKNLFHR